MFGVSGIGGYRWVLGSNKNITIDLGLGAGYFIGEVEISGLTYDALSGFLPTGLLSVGYSF